MADNVIDYGQYNNNGLSGTSTWTNGGYKSPKTTTKTTKTTTKEFDKNGKVTKETTVEETTTETTDYYVPQYTFNYPSYPTTITNGIKYGVEGGAAV